jgi:acetolactate synthase I/II/III large subunit
MKVAEVIYHKLVQKHCRYVFGYSGGACLPLLDAFYNSHHIQFIKNSNESCSGFVAEGYSKSLFGKQPGVILTTSGPGVTNIITPLQDAYSDGVPLIAISAQVPMNALHTNAFQECRATDLTKYCTKWNTMIETTTDIDDIIEEAYSISMEPRKGPVHIDIPKDILSQETNIQLSDIYTIKKPKVYVDNPIITKPKITDLLTNAMKPVLCVGQGCNHLSQEITYFVNKYKIPVTTTIHGIGIVDETQELSLGMCGMHGNPVANIALQEADVIIGVGMRFDDRITGNLSLYGKNARLMSKTDKGGIIHIDNSISQIKNVKSNFRKYHLDTYKFLFQQKMTSDFFLKSINKHIQTSNVLNKRQEWCEYLTSIKKRLTYYSPPTSKLLTSDVIKSIDKMIGNLSLDRNNIFFSTGVGNHQMWTAQHITWTTPGKMITSGSLGTMGVGVPFAIGSKLANEKSTVICIDGDSSFNMTSNELQTILENKINIKIAIMNDKRQQMVYIWQKLFHGGRIIATDNVNPDYNTLADSYKIQNIYCNRKEDLDRHIEYFLLYNSGPIIAVFDTEPSMCFPLVSPGKGLDDMIITPKDINNINKNEIAPN